MFKASFNTLRLFIAPRPAFTFPPSNPTPANPIYRVNSFSTRIEVTTTPFLDYSFLFERSPFQDNWGPSSSTPRRPEDTTNSRKRQKSGLTNKCCCSCHDPNTPTQIVTRRDFGHIGTRRIVLDPSSPSPAPTSRSYQTNAEASEVTFELVPKSPRQLLIQRRNSGRFGHENVEDPGSNASSSRSLRRSVGTISSIKDMARSQPQADSPPSEQQLFNSPKSQRSRSQSQSRGNSLYFELDLSPIIEDVRACDPAAAGSAARAIEGNITTSSGTPPSANGAEISLKNMPSSLSFSSLGGVIGKPQYQAQDLNHWDGSEATDGHTGNILDTSFAHSSTSCGRGTDVDWASIPAVVLTVPTPVPSKSPETPSPPLPGAHVTEDSIPTWRPSQVDSRIFPKGLGFAADELGVLSVRDGGADESFREKYQASAAEFRAEKRLAAGRHVWAALGRLFLVWKATNRGRPKTAQFEDHVINSLPGKRQGLDQDIPLDSGRRRWFGPSSTRVDAGHADSGSSVVSTACGPDIHWRNGTLQTEPRRRWFGTRRDFLPRWAKSGFKTRI